MTTPAIQRCPSTRPLVAGACAPPGPALSLGCRCRGPCRRARRAGCAGHATARCCPPCQRPRCAQACTCAGTCRALAPCGAAASSPRPCSPGTKCSHPGGRAASRRRWGAGRCVLRCCMPGGQAHCAGLQSVAACGAALARGAPGLQTCSILPCLVRSLGFTSAHCTPPAGLSVRLND